MPVTPKQAQSLKVFRNAVQLFSVKSQIRVGVVAKKLAFEGFAGVVAKTPVDTGRARASWNISTRVANKGVEPESRWPKGQKSTAESRANAKSEERLGGVSPRTPYTKFYILNNIPYIIYLEHGSSNQIPRKMVATTMQELRQQFNKIASETADEDVDISSGI